MKFIDIMVESKLVHDVTLFDLCTVELTSSLRIIYKHSHFSMRSKSSHTSCILLENQVLSFKVMYKHH